MSKKKKLRWGLLGTARINRSIIDPIRNSKYSILSAVASRSQEKVVDYAKNWGITRFFSSYDALLEDPEIDVIYNSLPNALHAQWSIKSMQMGKHVLCEKPITISSREMDSVISVAMETGMVICEAFMYRHHPQTKMVKQMTDDGGIGDLKLIRGSFCYTNTRHGDVRFDKDLGGGSLWDVGCYPISYARYIVGKEPIDVYGHQVTGETDIDLLYAGLLHFPGDVIAQFDCSFITPYTVFMEIIGTKGKITVPSPYKPGIKEKILFTHNGETQSIRIKGTKLYSGEVEDMENTILFGKSPQISLEDSRGNIITIEALYKSASLAKPICLQ